MLEKGVGYVPEDRQKNGLVSEFSIAENLMLNGSFTEPFTKGLSINFATRTEIAEKRVKEFDVRTTSSKTPAATLSG